MERQSRRDLARFLLLLVVVLPLRTLEVVGGGLARIRRWSEKRLRATAGRLLAWGGDEPLAVRGDVFMEPARHSLAHAIAPWLGAGTTNVIDVGARWGGGDAWWRLSPIAGLIGFEPDPEECVRLNSSGAADRNERYVPRALGRRSGTSTLHVAREPACSSLYPPDPNVYERYPQCAEIRTVSKQDVRLISLDEWWQAEGRPDISFLKVDTQGSELDVLVGGSELLGECLGCEVEVEFSPMYIGQPLFHEVDRFLRERGFRLWQLDSRCHYSEQPRQRLNRIERVHYDGLWLKQPAGGGRLFWGNAIYLRDYRELHASPQLGRQLLILACLLESAGDWDGACACLSRARATLGNELPDAVADRLERHLRALSSSRP